MFIAIKVKVRWEKWLHAGHAHWQNESNPVGAPKDDNALFAGLRL